jgi:hypothetical protein
MIRCLHCPMQFPEAPRGPVILGQSELEKLAKLTETLGTHLRMAHEEKFAESMLLVGEVVSFYLLSQFDISSVQAVVKARSRSAAAIQKLSRRALLDEDVRKIVAKTFADRGLVGRAEVENLLMQMRDWLAYEDAPSVSKT